MVMLDSTLSFEGYCGCLITDFYGFKDFRDYFLTTNFLEFLMCGFFLTQIFMSFNHP